MVTGDKKRFNAVNPHIGWVRWIGDYVVEDEERKRELSTEVKPFNVAE